VITRQFGLVFQNTLTVSFPPFSLLCLLCKI